MGKYRIITIERQYGSGGREIARKLAEKLGFEFYNEEILKMAAQKLNIETDYIQHLEETATNPIISAMARVANFTEDQQLSDKLFCAESDIINRLSLTGNAVIVGRCATQILANRKNCLRVFIHANDDVRSQRVIKEYHISEKEAHAALRKTDKRRSEFYNAHAEKKWASMSTYDVCLDSGGLGIDNCVEVISALAAKLK
ncbi:AAA family ATPase [Acetobacterium tundrae]|uniref:Cytidylate kinase-like family protein n=1 Tax=Acetobacterium tundrae TaxID=132932 RepID=A0ABR6WQJ2_9FIRM|nr:cytidylate kinase-like family protein [Acetobacterium tundrae]MBC3798387.1 cytidylate kinase-like family protein [Acetobacterium tundrae]